MRATLSTLVGAALIFGVSIATSPATGSAQSVAQKVEHTVKKGAKTTKHNAKHIAHETKNLAKTSARATSNAVVGHKILCADGTWASRDNPDCHGHEGLASRQPGDHDNHLP
jgi:hypothetical protein